MVVGFQKLREKGNPLWDAVFWQYSSENFSLPLFNTCFLWTGRSLIWLGKLQPPPPPAGGTWFEKGYNIWGGYTTVVGLAWNEGVKGNPQQDATSTERRDRGVEGMGAGTPSVGGAEMPVVQIRDVVFRSSKKWDTGIENIIRNIQHTLENVGYSHFQRH